MNGADTEKQEEEYTVSKLEGALATGLLLSVLGFILFTLLRWSAPTQSAYDMWFAVSAIPALTGLVCLFTLVIFFWMPDEVAETTRRGGDKTCVMCGRSS